MRERFVRRLHGDGGMALVEVVVALAVLTVSLVALLGAMLTSVQSVRDQRLRSSATRVASETLESLRAGPYADVVSGSRSVTTPDGQVFTVGTVVAGVDAETGAATGTAPGDLKQVTATVGWTSRGEPRELTLSTAVSPRAGVTPVVATGPGGLAGSIGVVTFAPKPLIVRADGVSTQPLTVAVPMTGFPRTQGAHVAWVNEDDDATAPEQREGLVLDLDSYDDATSAGVWEATIDAGRIDRQALLQVAGTGTYAGELPFTVTAGPVQRTEPLPLQREVASPPGVTVTLAPGSIRVEAPRNNGDCNGNNECENLDAVTFTVEVTGLDPAATLDTVTADTVKLRYLVVGGVTGERETPLARTAVTATSQTWSVTIGPGTLQFLTGAERSFTLTVQRGDDGASATTTVQLPVVAA